MNRELEKRIVKEGIEDEKKLRSSLEEPPTRRELRDMVLARLELFEDIFHDKSPLAERMRRARRKRGDTKPYKFEY
jgi:hypothetical protein